MPALTHPSPNFGDRRDGMRPDLIVIHYTAMPDMLSALARLCDPSAEVSAHYLIGADGRLCTLVDEANRAWHAGAGVWGGCADINSRSIGVELANDGTSPFAAAQMNTLEKLLADIMARHHIAPERVIAHSDMAPGRKSDPGPRFDWRRLALGGLSVWPRLGPGAGRGRPDEAAFFTAAGRFGYDVAAGRELILSAFRLRFRPNHAGPPDGTDLAMIQNLAERFPVDRGVASA